jgi:THO complex subunit 2
MLTGRFLFGILTDLWKWHQDEAAYTLDNRAKSGGKTVLLPGFQIKWSNKTTLEAKDLNTWANFKQLLNKFHRGLTKVRLALMTSLRCLLKHLALGPYKVH